MSAAVSVNAGFLPVLTYHAMDLGCGSPDPLAVTPMMMGQQLTALRDAGYRLTGLTEALATAAEDRVVAVTVDDAYLTDLEALPVLASVGATATLYVPAAHLGRSASWLADKPQLMSAEDVLTFRDAGIEIGSHGLHHAPIDELRRAQIVVEVAESRRLLQQLTDRSVVSFCYPHGYWDRRVRAAVADAGYSNACVLGHGLHRLGASPFTVRRLLVTRADDPTTLVERVRRTRPSLRRVVTTAGYVPWRVARRTRHRLGERW